MHSAAVIRLSHLKRLDDLNKKYEKLLGGKK